MLKDSENGDPSTNGQVPGSLHDVARADLTTDALAVLAELDAHGTAQIELMLRFGEIVKRAKDSLDHGKFTRWCEESLQRKPSWCSAHRRLFEAGNDLEPAREWATTSGHPWAKCVSVERLLKVIGDYRKPTRGDSAMAPRARRGAKPMTLRGAKRLIAELHKALEATKAEFIALRDPLPLEVSAHAAELAAANDVAAHAELAALALQFHWRLGDLLAQTCGAPQVSRPASGEPADPSPAVTDADESTSDEGSAS